MVLANLGHYASHWERSSLPVHSFFLNVNHTHSSRMWPLQIINAISDIQNIQQTMSLTLDESYSELKRHFTLSTAL